MSVVATVLVVLGLLLVVFELAAEYCTSDGTHNAMAAHLVAAKVSSSTTTHGAQKASVALLLHGGVTGTILLLSRLAVCVLALWILILTVRTLLRELALRLRAGVTSLLVLAVLPEIDVRKKDVSKRWSVWYLPLLLLLVVVTVLADLLAVLETTLRRRTVLRVVALLVPVPLLAILLLRLLVTTLLLLVAALVISTLLRIWAVPLLVRLLLLLAVALVVLIVARHVVCIQGLCVDIG